MIGRRGVLGGALAAGTVAAVGGGVPSPGSGAGYGMPLHSIAHPYACDELGLSALAQWYGSAQHDFFTRQLRALQSRQSRAFLVADGMRSWSPAFRRWYEDAEMERAEAEMSRLHIAHQAAQKLFVGG